MKPLWIFVAIAVAIYLSMKGQSAATVATALQSTSDVAGAVPLNSPVAIPVSTIPSSAITVAPANLNNASGGGTGMATNISTFTVAPSTAPAMISSPPAVFTSEAGDTSLSMAPVTNFSNIGGVSGLESSIQGEIAATPIQTNLSDIADAENEQAPDIGDDPAISGEMPVTSFLTAVGIDTTPVVPPPVPDPTQNTTADTTTETDPNTVDSSLDDNNPSLGEDYGYEGNFSDPIFDGNTQNLSTDDSN